MRRCGWVVLAAVILLNAGPSAADEAASPRCRASGHGADSFCQVGGARLHFVDWGGEGPPLLLLAGFGATARTFDDLAPRLTSQRRVIAVTRRGFGQSEQTPSAYTAARFTADLVELMDALGLERADLAGHSAAGAEIARIASEHPERVRRLVYLDAAYDFSNALTLQSADPLDRRPPASALSSLDAYIGLREAMLGVNSGAVRSDVRESFRVKDGRLQPVTPEAQIARIAAALLTGAPDFSGVDAPSLAIYAPKDQLEQPLPMSSHSERKASLRYGMRHIRPWMLREQAQFLEPRPVVSRSNGLA
jgi:pimeloyl-ACP methyl ester carboxylesterase